MRKKKILIIVTIVVIIIIVFLNLFIVKQKNKETISIPVISPTKIPFIIPTGEKVNVSNIEVDNFYKKEETILNSEKDALIVDNDDFQIVYLSQFNKFMITILNPFFEQTRIMAENIFLEKLNISQEQACQLEVEISTPSFVNSETSGEVYSLSFCQ